MNLGCGARLWGLSPFLAAAPSLTGCSSLFSVSHSQSFPLPAGTAQALPSPGFSLGSPLPCRSPRKEPLVPPGRAVPVESIALPGLHRSLFNILSHAHFSGHRHLCPQGQKENILLSVFREADDFSTAPSGSCILSETKPGSSPSRGRTNTLVLVACAQAWESCPALCSS